MPQTDEAARDLLQEQATRIATATDPTEALRQAASEMASSLLFGYLTYGEIAVALIPPAVTRGVAVKDAKTIVSGRMFCLLN